MSLTDQIKEVLNLAHEHSKTSRYFNVKSPSNIKTPFNYKVPSEQQKLKNLIMNKGPKKQGRSLDRNAASCNKHCKNCCSRERLERFKDPGCSPSKPCSGRKQQSCSIERLRRGVKPAKDGVNIQRGGLMKANKSPSTSNERTQNQSLNLEKIYNDSRPGSKMMQYEQQVLLAGSGSGRPSPLTYKNKISSRIHHNASVSLVSFASSNPKSARRQRDAYKTPILKKSGGITSLMKKPQTSRNGARTVKKTFTTGSLGHHNSRPPPAYTAAEAF